MSFGQSMLEDMGMRRYSVNDDGEIEWRPSPKIHTFYCDSLDVLDEWVALQRRLVPRLTSAWGAAKLANPSKSYKVSTRLLRLLPPLIVEICSRPHDRVAMEVTCNLAVCNDLGGLKLPPLFDYGDGFAAEVQRSSETLLLAMRPHCLWLLSRNFRRMLDGFADRCDD